MASVEGQSPLQELDVDPHSGSYILFILKACVASKFLQTFGQHHKWTGQEWKIVAENLGNDKTGSCQSEEVSCVSSQYGGVISNTKESISKLHLMVLSWVSLAVSF